MHLVHDEEVQRALEAACDKFRSAQAAWDDLTWAILKDRNLGKALNSAGTLRLVEDQGFRAIERPTIALVFKVEGDTTVVVAARFTVADAERAGSA